MEPEAARFRAALSAGSLGRALSLDQEQYDRRLDILRRSLDAPGPVTADWDLADELVSQFRGERIDREGLAESLDLLGLMLRDQAVTTAGRPQAALLGFGPMGPAWDIDRAAEGFTAVRQAQAQVLGNASPELTVAVLLGRLRDLRRGRAE
jgi:hypothetical protein